MIGKLLFGDKFNHYSLHNLQKDIVSGIIVGIIAIPLGMAFAIASGVKPEYGIYTTIIAGILISLFGGSRFQIGGPTGAFIPILLGIVLTYGYENLLIAGFLAGIMLLLMGVFRLGTLIKYIPKPVTIGFTSGIAVIIFTGQISNFLGLSGVAQREKFHENIMEIVTHLATLNIFSVLTALICLVTIILTPKIVPKIPGPLIGLLISTIIATIFYPAQVPTIGSTFGEISNQLPSFQMPDLTAQNMIAMLGPAFVIAILGGIESLLSAVVADGMTKTKHNSNRELIGQGIANIVTPFFGGIPATGAIARTATNIKNGATSPVAGIVHGVTVLIVLLLFAPYASNIPLASMAPILMVVAWNMSERRVFAHILKTRTEDSVVLVITFLLTVFANLTIAVAIGLLLAILLFVKRMSNLMVIAEGVPNHERKSEKIENVSGKKLSGCPQLCIFNIEGPLFFGAAQVFEQRIMKTIQYKPKILLLRMGRVPLIDTTGAERLESIVKDFSKHGIVIISGLNKQPKQVLQNIGLYDFIGAKHFFEHTGEAITYALECIDHQKCIGCKQFVFHECNTLSKAKQEHKAHVTSVT